MRLLLRWILRVEKYVKKILEANVYDVAIQTPLEMAPLLSSRMGSEVLLKREDMQPVFSFKIRGAYNKISRPKPKAREKCGGFGVSLQAHDGRGDGFDQTRNLVQRGDGRKYAFNQDQFGTAR